jgi:hypothetical protein
MYYTRPSLFTRPGHMSYRVYNDMCGNNARRTSRQLRLYIAEYSYSHLDWFISLSESGGAVIWPDLWISTVPSAHGT